MLRLTEAPAPVTMLAESGRVCRGSCALYHQDWVIGTDHHDNELTSLMHRICVPLAPVLMCFVDLIHHSPWRAMQLTVHTRYCIHAGRRRLRTDFSAAAGLLQQIATARFQAAAPAGGRGGARLG